MDNPLAREQRALTIVRRLNLQPGMTVLDAGCGPGRVTIPLARAVGADGKVVAIDIQEKMLQRARAKAEAAGVKNIEFRLRSIEPGALERSQYDCALLVTVLGEIPDRTSALREISRSLKPGGILSLTEIMFDPHYQSRRSILSSAAQAGLREKAFFGNRLAFTLHLEHAGRSGDYHQALM
jgi:ubiquinone/menaquinone biosynthesis C-methylase UbiE